MCTGSGVVALKITPIAHACHPSSKDAYYVYEVCRELKVPLMIHTGNGIPFADPTSVYQGAKDHPDVPVILAHAGSESFNQQARLLAKKTGQCIPGTQLVRDKRSETYD